MKALVLLIVAGMLSGCLAHNSTGRTIIQSANAYKHLTGGSYHGAGLEERVGNCIRDVLDPSNRGSGC